MLLSLRMTTKHLTMIENFKEKSWQEKSKNILSIFLEKNNLSKNYAYGAYSYLLIKFLILKI